MNRIGLTYLFVFSAFILKAQDIHFSQFQEAPLCLNPALAGTSPNWGRVNMNYRSQWSAFGKAYNTMGLSLDIPTWSRQKKQKSFLGVGLNVFNDKAGSSSFSKFLAAGDVSAIVKTSRGFFSGGIQVGYGQNSFNATGLKWSDQFDGVGYNSSIPVTEVLAAKRSYLDLGAGAAYIFTKNNRIGDRQEKNQLIIGLSAYHLNRPDMGLGVTDIAKLRYNLFVYNQHANPNTNIRFTESMLFSLQGKLWELNIGGGVIYLMKESSQITGLKQEKGMIFNLNYRVKDALIPQFGIYMGRYSVCISYDANISRLTPYSYGRGGFEISLKAWDVDGLLFRQGRKYTSYGKF
jgi:type IX secretion system PorP/SprF family membrane protein